MSSKGFTVGNDQLADEQQKAPRSAARRELPEERDDTPVSRHWKRPNPLRGGSEAGIVAKFIKTFKELVDGKEMSDVLLRVGGDAQKVLSQDNGWLVYVSPIAGEAFYTIIALETQTRPVAKYFNSRRRGSEYPTYMTVVDGIDNTMVDLIESWLREEVSTDMGTLVYSGCVVVPCEVDCEDPYSVAAYIQTAMDGNYTTSGQDKPFDGEDLDRNAKVVGSIAFGYDRPVGPDGVPIRADFSAEINVLGENDTNNPCFSSMTGTNIITAAGYIEANFVGVDNSRGRRDEVNTACFAPEIVINNIEYTADVQYGPIERQGMAMALVPYLIDRDRWMAQYRDNSNKPEQHDVRNFGYGLDIPGIEPGYIDASEEALQDVREYTKLMNSVFSTENSVEIAMMVREGGLGYGINKLLIDIASGALSEDILRDAWDALTGGKFSDRFEELKGTDIIGGCLRYPDGYWVDKTGKRSVDEIDTLFILGRARDKDVDMIDDWFDCNCVGDSNYSPDERMQRLLDIYSWATGDSFVHKGFRSKIYIDPIAIEALGWALGKSDLAMEVDYTGEDKFANAGRRSVRRRHGIRSDAYSGRRGGNDTGGRRGDNYRASSFRRNR